MAQVIEHFQGGTGEQLLPVLQADGVSPMDLTDATGLVFLVRERVDHTTAQAVVTATPTVTGDPELGLVAIRLVPDDTADLTPGEYTWCVRLTDSAGDEWQFPDPTQEPGRFLLKWR